MCFSPLSPSPTGAAGVLVGHPFDTVKVGKVFFHETVKKHLYCVHIHSSGASFPGEAAGPECR